MVDDLHLVLHLGLLRRLDGLAWYRDEAVVVAHVVHGLVQYRLVLVGFDDGSFEVVRNDYPWHSAIELESLTEHMEEVLCLLRWNTQRERVVTACHRAYKGLHLEVLSLMELELGLLVAVWMQTLVVLPHEPTRYMLVRQLLDKVGDLFQERLHTLVGVCWISRM